MRIVSSRPVARHHARSRDGHHAASGAIPRTRRRRLLAVPASLALAALALAGCAPSSPPPSASSSSSSAAADTGKEIDQLTVALPGSLASLYAGTEGGILNYYVAAIAQEGLLGVSPSGELVPALAEKWSQPDDTTWVFDLRADAEFSDGSPVTVEDVIASIDKAKDATVSPGTASYWPELASVEKTGDHQLTITLTAANQAFAWVVSAAGALWVAPAASWTAEVGTAANLPVGSGPYRATAFVPDSYAEFERVDTWWGGKPTVKKVRFEFIPDENTRLLARQSGDVDIALNVPINQAEQWQATEGTRVEFQPDNSYAGLTFDTKVAPFDDVHVRKAIAYAANRQGIVDGVLQGHGEVATGIPTPQALAAALGEDEAAKRLAALPQYDFDLDKAKSELAQSSVPNGFSTTLTYPNTGAELGKAALVLADDLKKIGIDVTVTEVPIEQWLSQLGDGVTGLSYMWYFATTGDVTEVTSYLLNGDNGNVAQYSNPDVTALLTQAAAEKDPAAQADLVLQANEIEAGQDVAYWPLWWGQSATAFADTVGAKDLSHFFWLSPWPSRIYAAG